MCVGGGVAVSCFLGVVIFVCVCVCFFVFLNCFKHVFVFLCFVCLFVCFKFKVTDYLLICAINRRVLSVVIGLFILQKKTPIDTFNPRKATFGKHRL